MKIECLHASNLDLGPAYWCVDCGALLLNGKWELPHDRVNSIESDETMTSHIPSRDVLKNYCAKYAYETRHGTEVMQDIILDKLMRYIRTGAI